MNVHPFHVEHEAIARRDGLIAEAAASRSTGSTTPRPRLRIVWPSPSFWFRPAQPAATPACCAQPA